MGALTQVYVNPAIAGNSGTGTIGDPYGDLQYALNTQVRDATNGDQFNIKAGTAEILAASLTLATYGTPLESAPLVLRGYTTAANDGGFGEINCNAATMWAATSYNPVIMVELVIHNFGNNNGIVLNGANFLMYRCAVHKGASSPSGKTLISNNNGGQVVGCYVHDAGTTGTGINIQRNVFYNYVYNCPTGISVPIGVNVIGNIVVDCTAPITIIGDQTSVIGNTVYSSTAATGTGINASSGSTPNAILNNIIEGFSGTGGKGINTVTDAIMIGYNAIYNCATPKSLADTFIDLTANDVALLASPFTNAAGGDFSLLTSVAGAIDGAFPGAWYGPASTVDHADMGAVQNGAGAGGGAVRISPIRGGL